MAAQPRLSVSDVLATLSGGAAPDQEEGAVFGVYASADNLSAYAMQHARRRLALAEGHLSAPERWTEVLSTPPSAEGHAHVHVLRIRPKPEVTVRSTFFRLLPGDGSHEAQLICPSSAALPQSAASPPGPGGGRVLFASTARLPVPAQPDWKPTYVSLGPVLHRQVTEHQYEARGRGGAGVPLCYRLVNEWSAPSHTLLERCLVLEEPHRRVEIHVNDLAAIRSQESLAPGHLLHSLQHKVEDLMPVAVAWTAPCAAPPPV